ncbi:MAG: 1-aminocyclopropane-1-carboxylate deaminase/D-cysteine desulfhydrase, partial [Sphingobacteriales bacterium]
TTYRTKTTAAFIESLKKQFGDFYLVPEGGSNLLGVKGCMEIMNEPTAISDKPTVKFDYVCCACGTGATLAGVTLSLKPGQKAIGFSVLKGGEFLNGEVERFVEGYKNTHRLGSTEAPPALPAGRLSRGDFNVCSEYHFGGYAKTTPELLAFKKAFEELHKIPLDQVYTAKMMFGLYDLVKKNYFKPGSKIIALHTGGLQGNPQI